MKKSLVIFSISIIVLSLIPSVVYGERGESESEVTSSPQSEETVSGSNDSEFTSVASEEAQSAHEHDYKIIKFNVESGVAVIRCSVCGHEYNDVFVHHLFNENHQTFMLSDEPWDVVPDETINGQDYAWLMREFSSDYSALSSFFNSHVFLYHQQFFYIYITIMFLVSTFIISITIRRAKK